MRAKKSNKPNTYQEKAPLSKQPIPIPYLPLGQPGIKPPEAIDGLNGIPMFDQFAVFDAPGIGDNEAFAIVPTVFGFHGDMAVKDDKISTGYNAFDIIAVFGIAFRYSFYRVDHALDAIRHSGVVLGIRRATELLFDIGKIMVIHEMLDKVDDHFYMISFGLGPMCL